MPDDSHIPLYTKVRNILHSEILNGQLELGQQLPCMEQLCEKHGVSNITMRRALNELADEGLIVRRRGQGTFVTEKTEPEHQASRTIALVFENVLGSFLAHVLKGIESVANDAGYELNLYVSNSSFEKERANLCQILENDIAGVILMCVNSEDGLSPNYNKYLEIRQRGIPLVFIDCYPPNTEFDCVHTTDFEGQYVITKHFIQLGHRKISFVTTPEKMTSTESRLSGFRQALKEHHLADNSEDIIICHRRKESPDGISNAMETINEYLRLHKGKLPDAFLCESDMIALGVYKALRKAGFNIPADVALGGFGDIPEASHLDVSLTTVWQPKETLGEAAVKLLLKKISNRQDTSIQRIVLPTKLVIRESCGSKLPVLTQLSSHQEVNSMAELSTVN